MVICIYANHHHYTFSVFQCIYMHQHYSCFYEAMMFYGITAKWDFKRFEQAVLQPLLEPAPLCNHGKPKHALLPITCTCIIYQGPLFYKHGLTLISAWTSYHIHYKLWHEITYPFPNFNGTAVEVWEWVSDFIPHLTGHLITFHGGI